MSIKITLHGHRPIINFDFATRRKLPPASASIPLSEQLEIALLK